MALKVLGQAVVLGSPPALTDLYTVPSTKSTAVSTIMVCNRSASATTFSIAVRPAGAAISNEHYIFYDIAIAGNDTFAATVGISLDETDVISVYSTSSDLSFSVFGDES